MAYFIDLFSPETYEKFSSSTQDITGFRTRHEKAASRISIGDKLICYMTKLSRWIGVLEVTSDYFVDNEPIFYSENDPFSIRFNVNPLVWLPKEKAIPIREDRIWNTLSFTKDFKKNSSSWTGKVRGSLAQLDEKDGYFLEQSLLAQVNGIEIFPFNKKDYEKLITHKVKRTDKEVTVTVPQDDHEEVADDIEPAQKDVRKSVKIQALLAKIGDQMGFSIWIPRNDKNLVLREWKGDHKPVMDILPLNYDEVTLKTIEQIDILWLRGRSIARAFEVEHTTSIYSGILRMADLLALQPNMDIKLHIVAPSSRRDKVFQELSRPVFSLLDRGPLSDSCTYISYDSIIEISKEKHLSYLSDSVLDEYSESEE